MLEVIGGELLGKLGELREVGPARQASCQQVEMVGHIAVRAYFKPRVGGGPSKLLVAQIDNSSFHKDPAPALRQERQEVETRSSVAALRHSTNGARQHGGGSASLRPEGRVMSGRATRRSPEPVVCVGAPADGGLK
jgi:hypothetical protein